MAQVWRRRSVTGRRLRPITPDEQELICALYSSGRFQYEVAQMVGRSQSAVAYIVNPMSRARKWQYDQQRRMDQRVREEEVDSALLYQKEHRSEVNAYHRRYEAANRERFAGASRRSYVRNRLARLAHARQYRADNREEINTRQRRARAENPGRFRAYDRKRRRNGNTSI